MLMVIVAIAIFVVIFTIRKRMGNDNHK